MGRHQKHSDHRLTRALLTSGAVGVGVLQATVPAFAAPAAPAPAPAAPAPAPATGPAKAPCEAAAKACVSISQQKAWLTDGKGNVLRGPIRMTHGAPGAETPLGSFKVTRKDAKHVSQEQHGTPMPWSVFFDNNGRAFHGGSLARQSAGCVHLEDSDAQFFFEHLNVGDAVQIVQ